MYLYTMSTIFNNAYNVRIAVKTEIIINKTKTEYFVLSNKEEEIAKLIVEVDIQRLKKRYVLI